jgi:hypothetical protein
MRSTMLLVMVTCVAIATTVMSMPIVNDPSGVIVAVGDHWVGLYVSGPSGFRVSVTYSSDAAQGMDQSLSSPMIPPPPSIAPYKVIHDGSWVGVQTSYGQVRVDTGSNSFQMWDANSKVITNTSAFAQKGAYISPKSTMEARVNKNDTCLSVFSGMDAVGGQRTPSCPNGLAGQTQASCCSACNSDPDCTFWVWATPDHPGNSLFLASFPIRLSMCPCPILFRSRRQKLLVNVQCPQNVTKYW